jgi:hypothetical protein
MDTDLVGVTQAMATAVVRGLSILVVAVKVEVAHSSTVAIAAATADQFISLVVAAKKAAETTSFMASHANLTSW